jgi:hypothetical protein
MAWAAVHCGVQPSEFLSLSASQVRMLIDEFERREHERMDLLRGLVLALRVIGGTIAAAVFNSQRVKGRVIEAADFFADVPRAAQRRMKSSDIRSALSAWVVATGGKRLKEQPE